MKMALFPKGPGGEGRRWLWGALLWGLNGLALVATAAYAWDTLQALASLTRTPTDFTNYYLAARQLLRGKDIYGDLGPAGEEIGLSGVVMPYTLTPLFALLFAPLTALSYEGARWVWTGLQIFLVAISLAAVVRALGLRVLWRYLGFFLFLVALFPPLREELNEGQVSLVLLALVVAAWSQFRSGRKVLAGALLGLAAAIKLFPFMLAVYFLLKKEGRVFAAAAVTAVALTVASAALVGPGAWGRYATGVLPGLSVWYGHHDNHSLTGFFLRLFGDTPYTVPLYRSPELARFAILLASLAVLAAAATAWWHHPLGPPLRLEVELSLAIFAMLLISPITWGHYLVFTYFPLLVLARWLQGQEAFQAWAFDLTAASYLLLSLPAVLLLDPVVFSGALPGGIAGLLGSLQYNGQPYSGAALLLGAGKFYGLGVGYGLCLMLLKRRYETRLN